MRMRFALYSKVDLRNGSRFIKDRGLVHAPTHQRDKTRTGVGNSQTTVIGMNSMTFVCMDARYCSPERVLVVVGLMVYDTKVDWQFDTLTIVRAVDGNLSL